MPCLDKNGLAHLWGKIKGLVAGKQDKLIPDDSIEITDGNGIGVKLPAKHATISQYQQLSAEEKAGKLWVVPESPPIENPEFSPWDYSTEEQQIGTWIDGKPLYQLAFDAIIPNGNGLLFEKPDIDSLIYAMGSIKNLNPVVPLNYIVPSDIFAFGSNSNGIYVYPANESKNKHGFFVIRYTKTTDEGVS